MIHNRRSPKSKLSDCSEKDDINKDRKQDINQRATFLFLSVVLVISLLVVSLWRPSRFRLVQVVTLLPVGGCLYSGTLRRRHLRLPAQESILPLTLVATVLSSQLPLFVAAALAAGAITGYSLLTLHYQAHKPPASPDTVVKSLFVLVAVLLSENFMIWVVSATFKPGQTAATAPLPLQDNGQFIAAEILFTQLTKKEIVQGLRRLWNVQWSLVACMGSSFILVDIFDPQRHLYGFCAHALWTLAAARFIRTVSFCLTVLPSPVKYCYTQRYPYPPPSTWSEWIWVGLLPASHGGCNDLIVSGHATVTSTMACLITSTSSDWLFQVSLWTLLVLDYAVEVYEGFHYSVDMWMGAVLVNLLWRTLHWTEHEAGSVRTTDGANTQAEVIPVTAPTVQEAVPYVIPALVAYLQLVVLPSWTANFLIVGFVLVIIWLFTHQTTQRLHFGRHVALCLLFMALGIYL